MPPFLENIHTLPLMFVFTLKTIHNSWSRVLDPSMLLDASTNLMLLEEWECRAILRMMKRMKKKMKTKKRKLLPKRLVEFLPNLNNL